MSILVAYDHSDAAKRALDEAARLAKALNEPLLVVYSVEPYLPPADLAGAAAGQWTDELLTHARRVLGEVQKTFENQGLTVRTETPVGPAAPELLAISERPEVTMVVVGRSWERSGISRAILGSVANRLVQAATKPVLIVH